MSNKHSVTFQGDKIHTWKRVSQNRVYTHMVIGQTNIAADRAATAAWARKAYASNLEYYQMKAFAPVYTGTFADGSTFTTEITDLERAAAKATIEAGVEGEVADRLREFDKRTADAWKSADGQSMLYSAGWTSRLDLAVKLAARTPGAIIVEAVRS